MSKILISALCASILLCNLRISAQTTPQLTTEELLRLTIHDLELKLEVAVAEQHICEGDLGQWRQAFKDQQLTTEQATLTKLIQDNHPGFLYDFASRTFTLAPPKKP